jgi:hypothetical protein
MLTDVYSRNIETARDIDLFYESLVSMLNISSASNIPTSKYNADKKPYWSPSVKHAQAHAREKRNVWVTHGRPRGMLATENISRQNDSLGTLSLAQSMRTMKISID